MGLRSRIGRAFGGSAEDESAEAEEYDLPDPGARALHDDPAPSLLGGLEAPGEGPDTPSGPAP